MPRNSRDAKAILPRGAVAIREESPLAICGALPHVSSHSPHMKLFLSRSLAFFALAVLAIGLSACTTTAPGSKRTSFTFDPPVKHPTNPKAVKLFLSTGAQRLYAVEGGTVLLATPVTVGEPATPTPHGKFTIYSKQEHRRRVSSPGAGYPMTYWMEFKPAYGLHWGFMDDDPATHGCVRVPLKAVKKVYSLVRIGTPLDIARSQPWDATIGRQLPVLDDEALPNPPNAYMLSPKVFQDQSQGKMWNF